MPRTCGNCSATRKSNSLRRAPARLFHLANLTVVRTAAKAPRIHRVTPEFIRQLQAAGYADIPAKKLVQMRIHGVDGKYLNSLK